MKLTIVIPTFNRPHAVQGLVDSLRATGNEIIVVDDCSPIKIAIEGARVIRNPRNMGASYSRNLGAFHASNEWILFLDDDMFPDETFFESLELLSQLADAIGFKLIGAGGTRTTSIFNRLLNILFGTDIPRESGYSKFVPAAILIRKDWFFRIGGYDVQAYRGNCFREESDVQMRLHKAGARIYYTTKPALVHIRREGGYDKVVDLRKWGFDYLRNQVVFASRQGSLQAIVMIIGFSLYMVSKGVGIKTLIRGITAGLLERSK